jgi:tetratricopeptide (TPR) repeat protein
MRLAAAILSVVCLFAGSSDDLQRAAKLYRYTDYDGSLRILQAIPVKDAPVLELIGKDYFEQGEFKKATEYLGKALAADPNNSDYTLWLGRAYGRRAETASPFTAPLNASKARQYFERAVELNPRNMEAMSDLFEYYMEAPGFMGGGLDKAALLAKRMGEIEPAEGQVALARLAERRNELPAAEQHLQRAAEMAPGQVGRLIELARFFGKQGRYQESEQAFRKAEKVAPNNARLMYARAHLYVEEGRNLDTARLLLQRYMQAQLTPDDPPRADAEKLMKKASGG